MKVFTSGLLAMKFPQNLSVKNIFSDPSTVFLLYTNLFTILLGLMFSWNVLEFMWVYWAQSVIIGIFSFARILAIVFSPISDDIVKAISFMMGFSFIMNYGITHLAYFAVLLGASLGASYLFPLANFDFVLFLPFLALTSLIFFINHLFSFIQHSKDAPSTSAESIIFINNTTNRAFGRIIPMQVTIILGGFIFVLGFMNQFILLLFLLVKTLADLSTHIDEHRKN